MIEYHQITCRYFTWKKGLATFIGALWHQVANNLKHSGFVKKNLWLQSIIAVLGNKSNSHCIATKCAVTYLSYQYFYWSLAAAFYFNEFFANVFCDNRGSKKIRLYPQKKRDCFLLFNIKNLQKKNIFI